MRKLTRLLVLILGFILLVIACVTINIYFPEAAVQKTAEEIVEEIRKSEEEANKKLTNKAYHSSFVFMPAAFAQDEKKVSTPKIRALKQSLKDREPLLLPFFEKGNIGEANDGYIQIRNEDDLSLKDKAELRRLIKDVNSDRENLYAEVAKALNIDQGQIPRIQKIFAKSWIENSHSGWWIQNETGEWVRKNP
jgi:uncharacterized protein YdbL (DUF1318 family)